MSKVVAPALKALLEGFIDYAGIFPPAKLTVETAVANYEYYRNGEYSWMLHNLVVSPDKIESLPQSLSGQLAVLGEVDESRASSLETKNIVVAKRPVYCEVSPGDLRQLDAVKKSGCFAKIRTGGVVPEAIPAPSVVSSFITACAERRLPFKATAGLHHPIRAVHPLTYEPDAPRAIMHGFINVLLASAFAWHGEREIEPIVADTDPRSFSFDTEARWGNRSLSVDAIRKARQEFIHSVGSCSFDEPVHDLKALGLL